MRTGDLIKPNSIHNRKVNKEMQEWLDKNAERTFRVENVVDDSVKLFKMDFWITEDLLSHV